MFNSPLNAKPKDVSENLSCYTSFPCFNTTLFFLSFLTYFTVRKHWYPILEQTSLFSIPYPIPNSLKTIPFTAAHTPPPPGVGEVLHDNPSKYGFHKLFLSSSGKDTVWQLK